MEALKRLVLIGSTGTGKSASCNSLCGEANLYPVSAQATSMTYETKALRVKWFGRHGLEEFLLIDTPGLGDTEAGRDAHHIENMVSELKKQRFVNGFLIVFNGQNPRFDEHLQTMLKLFKGMFGQKFFENTAFLFTRWSYAKKDVRTRKNNNDTEADKQISFNKHLADKGIYIDALNKPLKCFFIDNSLNNQENFEDSTDEEQEKYLAVREEIKAWLKNLPNFECKDFEEVELENARLKREREEAEAVLEREKEKAKKERMEAAEKIKQVQKKAEEEKKKADSKVREQEKKVKYLLEQEQLQREADKEQAQIEQAEREMEHQKQLYDEKAKIDALNAQANRQQAEMQNQLRISNGGCRLCDCQLYDFNSSRTIDDNRTTGLAGQFTKVLLHELTLGVALWNPLADNRCDCGHLNSEHANKK